MNATYFPRWKTQDGVNVSIPKECIELHFPSEPDIVNQLDFGVDTILTAPAAFSFIVYLLAILSSNVSSIFCSSVFAFAIYVLSFHHIITVNTTLASVFISAYRLIKFLKINWIILIVLCFVYKTPFIIISYMIATIFGFILRILFFDRMYATSVSNKIGCNIGLSDILIIKLMKKLSQRKLNFYSYAHYIARYIIEANFNEVGDDAIGDIHPACHEFKS